jgi:hypothetical protein
METTRHEGFGRDIEFAQNDRIAAAPRKAQDRAIVNTRQRR